MLGEEVYFELTGKLVVPWILYEKIMLNLDVI